MTTRMRLTRLDTNKVFLERRGWECKWFGVYLHKMDAPDPGQDVHTHPWTFYSIVLKGMYSEVLADNTNPDGPKTVRFHPPLRFLRLGLEQAHRIIHMDAPVVTLVLRGPRRRRWAFWLWDEMRWVDHSDYDSERRNAVVYEDLGRKR